MSDTQPWEDTPLCPRPDGPGATCYGPLIPKHAADWKHRAMGDHRLVCCACGEGQVGTDAEVEQAEKAQRAWEAELARQNAMSSSTTHDSEDLY